MVNWLTRIFQPSKARALEGSYRPGPYYMSDGWLSAKAGQFWNFWQMGYNVQPYSKGSAMVEACVSAYAQTVAMCPGAHWRTEADGGRTLVTNSSLYRFLKKPNEYQSISDYMLNLVSTMYNNGEAFALASRNNRGEIDALHLMKDGGAVVAEDGSVFYRLGGNDIAVKLFGALLEDPIPARDVLHVRLRNPAGNPLKGVSPVMSTVLEQALAGAAMSQQVAFYLNQARPSYILETDQQLSRQLVDDLRTRWESLTTGENAGRTPITSHGLKAHQMQNTASDGQLVDLLKMSDQNVALAFRLPLAILGVGGTPFASTEALMSSWKASGLGFCLNHVEEAIGNLFGLKGQPEEYLEFDTEALLRSSFKEMIEGLSRGTISGIYSSDEARNKVGLPKVPNGAGAEPRVQQQVVPLSFGMDMKPPDPNPPAALPAPANEDTDDDAGRSFDEFTRRDIDELAEQHLAALHRGSQGSHSLSDSASSA